MKKLLSIISILFLIGTVSALAQDRKLSAYAIGFYNLENLFDTQHDEGHNDYEYLPEGRNKWTGMKYTHKLRNMARVLADMGTDKLPMVGCAAIGVSEVENANVTLYPNPLSNILHIEAQGIQEVNVMDINGRTVMSMQNANTIDMSNLASGVYFVRVITTDGVSTQKITRQ